MQGEEPEGWDGIFACGKELWGSEDTDRQHCVREGVDIGFNDPRGHEPGLRIPVRVWESSKHEYMWKRANAAARRIGSSFASDEYPRGACKNDRSHCLYIHVRPENV